MLRLLIVDDEPLVRHGLRMILDGEPDLSVVGEAGDGAAAVSAARALQPDVVCLDVRMPDVDGIRATELLLGLDRDITLILIEHDMDIALTVAERVTMMHDGRVIVEGTPDEIRANETVHDLYLGRGYGHE